MYSNLGPRFEQKILESRGERFCKESFDNFSDRGVRSWLDSLSAGNECCTIAKSVGLIYIYIYIYIYMKNIN